MTHIPNMLPAVSNTQRKRQRRYAPRSLYNVIACRLAQGKPVYADWHDEQTRQQTRARVIDVAPGQYDRIQFKTLNPTRFDSWVDIDPSRVAFDDGAGHGIYRLG